MNPSGRYNQVELRQETGGFTLAFEAEWDPTSCAIFGVSGAGKSTILEMIAGARPVSSGRVVLDGRTILDTERGILPPARLRWVGWVPQEACVFPHLSARENVEYGLPRGGEGGAQRLAAALDALELGDLLDRRGHELSGGERQRVAIARAIGSGARVLMLDEPLASIDLPLRARAVALLMRLRDELRIPMIYVSHDADEVVAVAEHVLIADRGRCVASGRAKDLMGEAVRRELYGMPGAENRFSVRVVEVRPEEGTALVELPTGLRLTMSAMPSPSRERFEVSVRPEEIILAALPPGALSAQNVLEARVDSIEEREGHAWVRASADRTPFVARITRRALASLGIAPGAKVHLVFKAGSVRECPGSAGAAGASPPSSAPQGLA